MDNGAHFYRCDFQMHSPRDSHWKGQCPTSDTARMKFAKKLVNRCRDKGLEAIAVTDHHDMCFVPYLQSAAQNADRLVNKPRPGKQDPIIFPGAELTVSVPCQAIVLLDAGAPRDLHNALLSALGLKIPPGTDAHGPKVKKLPFESLVDLHQKLSDNEELRGRFIILPHVCRGGHKSVVEASFNEKYRAMPCVGGYVECSFSELKPGNVAIVEGTDPQWGCKPVGVFQTSDARALSEVGTRSSWVKIARPTAEALRQACLARRSRICHETPDLPSRYVTRLVVSDSVFMGAVEQSFNCQFNAMIGGRGTGKSTLLEYLRWAMHDEPGGGDTHDPQLLESRRRLVEDTLVKVGGAVTVEWMVDGAEHSVTRDADTNITTLAVGDGSPKPIQPEDVRNLLPIRAYSQKQLSAVGSARRELVRFVEQPLREELREVERRIEQQEERVRTYYKDAQARLKMERELQSVESELQSDRQRVASIKKSLPKLSKKAEKALSEHAARSTEHEAVVALRGDFEALAEVVNDAVEGLEDLPSGLALKRDSPQAALLEKVQHEIAKQVGQLADSLRQAEGRLEASQGRIERWLASWASKHETHCEAYTEAQEEHASHKEKIGELNELQKGVASLEKKLGSLKKSLSKKKDVEKRFAEAWGVWMQLHRQRGDVVEKRIRTVEDSTGGDIRATLVRCADVDDAIEAVGERLSGARISKQQWDALEQRIVDSRSPADAWQEFLLDLRPLAEEGEEDHPSDYVPDGLESWPELNERQRKVVLRKLTPEAWIELALFALKDLPRFEYSTGSATIPFEQASAGQQATALLKALLRDSEAPLVIDQPEDDINNAEIGEIVEQLWEAKKRRQIIIASHNANLVVNGDAELVIHCNYASQGDHSKGHVENDGAIDAPVLRNAITTVMEGGEEAFRLRKAKYGF